MIRKFTRSVAGERGLSIIELLVAMVVALMFALAGWMFQRAQAHELSNQVAEIDGTEKIRSALWFLSREIRGAGTDPLLVALTTAGSTGISEARQDRLLVQFDTNSDGVIDPNATDPDAESVLYTYNGGNQSIQRTVAGVTQTLITDVPGSGLQLTYYDSAGNELVPAGSPATLSSSQRDLVAFVRVRLRVISETRPFPTTLRLSSRVTIRNRILGIL